MSVTDKALVFRHAEHGTTVEMDFGIDSEWVFREGCQCEEMRHPVKGKGWIETGARMAMAPRSCPAEDLAGAARRE
eukprot:gene18558-1150_t